MQNTEITVLNENFVKVEINNEITVTTTYTHVSLSMLDAIKTCISNMVEKEENTSELFRFGGEFKAKVARLFK